MTSFSFCLWHDVYKPLLACNIDIFWFVGSYYVCSENDFRLAKVHPRRPRGSQSGREKRRDESFQAEAEEPLNTDSHQIISKRSSECWPLIGRKKMLCIILPNRRTTVWLPLGVRGWPKRGVKRAPRKEPGWYLAIVLKQACSIKS